MHAVAPSPSNLDTAPQAGSENAGEAGLKEPVVGDAGTVGGDEGLLDSASTLQKPSRKKAEGPPESAAAADPVAESTSASDDSAAGEPVTSSSSLGQATALPAPSEPPVS